MLGRLWTHSLDSQSTPRQRRCVEICRLDSAQKPRGAFYFPSIYHALNLTAEGRVTQYNRVKTQQNATNYIY